jgi:3-hydroxyisobutyrate dehydrogenase-like beta-hydroxyacid dehydrogenase
MRIALIGYGEVGQTLAADLFQGGSDLVVWDRLFATPDGELGQLAGKIGHIRPSRGMKEAVAGRGLVVSAVTAAECVAAAREASSSLLPGTYYLDLNSVSPASKAEAAGLIEAKLGRYVEGAVMSPIRPRGVASPILVGGPHAQSFLPLARSLGFLGAQLYSERIGDASAAKMCRSVMIKGLEALLTESLLAARYYGVEDVVLASLQDQFPANDWPQIALYMITRSLQHGRRRAEEMREAARTVSDAGIDALMSHACADRQDWASAHFKALEHGQLAGLLDALLGKGEIEA